MLAAIGDLLSHVPNRLEVRAAVGPDVSWEAALVRARAVATALRQGGYVGDPVVMAGMGGAPISFALRPTREEPR